MVNFAFYFTFLLWILFIIVLRKAFFKIFISVISVAFAVMEKSTPMHMLLWWINIVSYSINMRQFLKTSLLIFFNLGNSVVHLQK